MPYINHGVTSTMDMGNILANYLQDTAKFDDLRTPPSYVRNWSLEGTFQRPTSPDL